MYTTCLHCNTAFGQNDAIEALPVGRRLAFDAAKGRLWVVCRHCDRWNLTPFEERWEAVEQCERTFRETRVRLSTDHIGLARLRDGTDLVRIGAPLRPEFAAWRYGDQFGKRRTRMLLTGTGVVVGTGLLVSGAAAAGVALAAVLPIVNVAAGLLALQRQYAIMRDDLLIADGRRIMPTGAVRLLSMPDVPEGWGVEAEHQVEVFPSAMDEYLQRSQRGNGINMYAAIRGDHAIPLLRRLMPRINGSGASRTQVGDGVAMIEAAGGPDTFARWAAGQRHIWAAQQTQGDTGSLSHIPMAARLAFEMALNEDSEQRALAGELSILETAWRREEVVAAVADTLLIPPQVDARLAQMRARDRTARRRDGSD